MPVLEEIRSELLSCRDQNGDVRGSFLFGGALFIALEEQNAKEPSRLQRGQPARTESQIFLDALEDVSQDWERLTNMIWTELSLVEKEAIQNGISEFYTARISKQRKWTVPLAQGVASNFIWLFTCGVLVWIAFVIKQDWQSIVQSWFIGA